MSFSKRRDSNLRRSLVPFQNNFMEDDEDDDKKSDQRYKVQLSDFHNAEIEDPLSDPAIFNPEQLSVLKDAFMMFDADHSGSIDLKELIEAMKSLGLDRSKADIESMLYLLDEDKSDKIEFEEFVGLMRDEVFCYQNLEKQMKEVFTYYMESQDLDELDKISQTCITAEKLKIIAASLDDDLDDETAQKMIEIGDFGGEGAVSVESFMSLMWKLGMYDKNIPEDDPEREIERHKQVMRQKTQIQMMETLKEEQYEDDENDY